MASKPERSVAVSSAFDSSLSRGTSA